MKCHTVSTLSPPRPQIHRISVEGSRIRKEKGGNSSSSLRPGTKEFTRGKWIIGYNFGIDDGAESKFGTHKELIVLNIFEYKYCVHKSRGMSRDHLVKNRKLLAIDGRFKERNQAITLLLMLNISTWHFTYGMTIYCT